MFSRLGRHFFTDRAHTSPLLIASGTSSLLPRYQWKHFQNPWFYLLLLFDRKTALWNRVSLCILILLLDFALQHSWHSITYWPSFIGWASHCSLRVASLSFRRPYSRVQDARGSRTAHSHLHQSNPFQGLTSFIIVDSTKHIYLLTLVDVAIFKS